LITLSFNSGYALFLLGGAIFLASLWIVAGRLDSRDLKDLLSGLLGAWLPVLGWLLFVGGSVIYFLAFKWMKDHYEREIDRQRELLERFLPPDTKKDLDLR
jgi:4-amino-4-deoxy-L-arabinose transferase-like glycosyltransferase